MNTNNDFIYMQCIIKINLLNWAFIAFYEHKPFRLVGFYTINVRINMLLIES